MDSSDQVRPKEVSTLSTRLAIGGLIWLLIAGLDVVGSVFSWMPWLALVPLFVAVTWLAAACGLFVGARWAWNISTLWGRIGGDVYYRKDVLDFLNIKDY